MSDVKDHHESKDKKRRRNLFRFKGKAAFLTFPQWRKERMDEKEFEAWVQKNFIDDHKDDYLVFRWTAAQEPHQDGTIHFHLYLEFGDVFETRNQLYWDKYGKHGNYQVAKSRRAIVKYIHKGGRFVGTIAKEHEVQREEWTNFRKVKEDKEAWELEQEFAARKEITWPIIFPWFDVPKPDPVIKKRHYWFIGRPDLGKTHFTDLATLGMKVFWCGEEKQYRFENYRNEQLIIYNDCHPSRRELIKVSDTINALIERPNKRRYNAGYWRAGTVRTIIVLDNNPPPDDWTGAFQARFHVIQVLDDAEYAALREKRVFKWLHEKVGKDCAEMIMSKSRMWTADFWDDKLREQGLKAEMEWEDNNPGWGLRRA